MYKNLFIIFLFLNIFSNISVSDEKFDQDYRKIYDDYNDCIWSDTQIEHFFAIEYDLYEKLGIDESPLIYNCNKILKEVVNKDLGFKDLIDKAISENKSQSENIGIKIYLAFHDNILWHSKDELEIKKTLIELENNYLKRSNILTNLDAVRLYGSLGWFYNVDKNFFNMQKAHDFMSIAAKNEKVNYYLKYYINNLGVIYDQDRYGNFSTKKNNELAFKLYKEAAELGLHYAYGNLGKFYILGLGGIKKDYDNAIKFYKLGRIAPYGNDNFAELVVLYDKQRLPINLKEYLSWLEDYLIETKDTRLFQQIAWLTDEDEFKKNRKDIFINTYKWQYLCSIYCEVIEDKNRAKAELAMIKKFDLSTKETIQAETRALKWYKENWNQKSNSIIKDDLTLKEKEFIDLIRDALIRN